MRRTTEEERALFRDAVLGRAPAKRARAAAADKHPVRKKPAAKAPSGLDGNTGRRLTRGELAPDCKLDLHGLTEAAAYRALTCFLQAAHRRGDRLALVVTGKGGAAPDTERGVLKRMVPRWLDEAPLARLVAEKRSAHRRHGGDGALYVYLRKPPRR